MFHRAHQISKKYVQAAAHVDGLDGYTFVTIRYSIDQVKKTIVKIPPEIVWFGFALHVVYFSSQHYT